MKHLICIFFFFLFLSDITFGQASKRSPLQTKFNLKLSEIKRKIITDSIININGDSAIALADDTAFIRSFEPLWSGNYDRQICSVYKIPYIITPLGWISDFENIFTAVQIQQLDSTLNIYERQTFNEIAVLTFDSSYIQNDDFDSLVSSIHDLWGVGKIDTNNGVLIGISISKRKIRISNGYGIQDKLSDEETKEIIDKVIIPAFRKGNYFEGLERAIAEIILQLK